MGLGVDQETEGTNIQVQIIPIKYIISVIYGR